MDFTENINLVNLSLKIKIITATQDCCLKNYGSVELAPHADTVSTKVEAYDFNKGSNYWTTTRLDCITLYRGFFFWSPYIHEYLHKF